MPSSRYVGKQFMRQLQHHEEMSRRQSRAEEHGSLSEDESSDSSGQDNARAPQQPLSTAQRREQQIEGEVDSLREYLEDALAFESDSLSSDELNEQVEALVRLRFAEEFDDGDSGKRAVQPSATSKGRTGQSQQDARKEAQARKRNKAARSRRATTEPNCQPSASVTVGHVSTPTRPPQSERLSSPASVPLRASPRLRERHSTPETALKSNAEEAALSSDEESESGDDSEDEYEPVLEVSSSPAASGAVEVRAEEKRRRSTSAVLADFDDGGEPIPLSPTASALSPDAPPEDQVYDKRTRFDDHRADAVFGRELNKDPRSASKTARSSTAMRPPADLLPVASPTRARAAQRSARPRIEAKLFTVEDSLPAPPPQFHHLYGASYHSEPPLNRRTSGLVTRAVGGAQPLQRVPQPPAPSPPAPIHGYLNCAVATSSPRTHEDDLFKDWLRSPSPETEGHREALPRTPGIGEAWAYGSADLSPLDACTVPDMPIETVLVQPRAHDTFLVPAFDDQSLRQSSNSLSPASLLQDEPRTPSDDAQTIDPSFLLKGQHDERAAQVDFAALPPIAFDTASKRQSIDKRPTRSRHAQRSSSAATVSSRPSPIARTPITAASASASPPAATSSTRQLLDYYDFEPQDPIVKPNVGMYICKRCRDVPLAPGKKRLMGRYTGKKNSPSDVSVRAFQHWDKKHEGMMPPGLLA